MIFYDLLINPNKCCAAFSVSSSSSHLSLQPHGSWIKCTVQAQTPFLPFYLGALNVKSSPVFVSFSFLSFVTILLFPVNFVYLGKSNVFFLSFHSFRSFSHAHYYDIFVHNRYEWVKRNTSPWQTIYLWHYFERFSFSFLFTSYIPSAHRPK